MFSGPNLINAAYQVMLGHARFQANIGIYRGFTDKESNIVKGGQVYCTLIQSPSVEIGIQDEEELADLILAQKAVLCRNGDLIIENDNTRIIIMESRAINTMNLGHTDTVAYVGPEEIARVLSRESNGLLDEYFRSYVEKHRAV